MEGKSNYKPTEGFENGMHVIGPGESPIYICRKRDVPKLFDDNFWKALEIWQYFHHGFGLPGQRPWDEQDPFLMKCLLQMESHFQYNFSQEHYMLEMLKGK